MLNRIRLNKEEMPNYNVESLMNLAMEKNWLVGRIYKNEPEKIDYTLMQLSMMPFEQWARLIEIENINNND